jgi:hypothetical protein
MYTRIEEAEKGSYCLHACMYLGAGTVLLESISPYCIVSVLRLTAYSKSHGRHVFFTLDIR